jgi:hypothetical protein
LREGDLAVGVGGLGGVVAADVPEVVVDGDGFVGERGGAALEGGGEGDGLADGGGAVVAASVTMVWALTVTFTPLLVAFVTVLPPAYVARK